MYVPACVLPPVSLLEGTEPYLGNPTTLLLGLVGDRSRQPPPLRLEFPSTFSSLTPTSVVVSRCTITGDPSGEK